jgi:hypothetical protein
MSNHLAYIIREIIEELDGAGLVITDQEEIEETLKELGIDIDVNVQTVELDD